MCGYSNNVVPLTGQELPRSLGRRRCLRQHDAVLVVALAPWFNGVKGEP